MLKSFEVERRHFAIRLCDDTDTVMNADDLIYFMSEPFMSPLCP
jgi:hypothetical protein